MHNTLQMEIQHSEFFILNESADKNKKGKNFEHKIRWVEVSSSIQINKLLFFLPETFKL